MVLVSGLGFGTHAACVNRNTLSYVDVGDIDGLGKR
jgi:hypothetical protein